ncbi:Aldehyde dehydrogenase 3 member I1, chloroplastic [Borealophlyctis nickersoniae]|nr:Aldehyde dehydrogenase 3 member I1, chloroplastic [Borealophlyctis nickersoniae]
MSASSTTLNGNGLSDANPLVYTPVADIPKKAAIAREAFKSGRTLPVAFRKQQLVQLYRFLKDEHDAIVRAMVLDLKEPLEAVMEVEYAKSAITHLHDHVEKWARGEKINDTTMMWVMDDVRIIPEPLGTTLIISPWNYPVVLCIDPLAGAISAGCAAVLKPSELAPHTSQMYAELLPKYLDPELYQVVNGAVAETTKALDEKWDHIFYTGNGKVARIIAAAAAKHLTPTTLELGGKSPVILDDTADLEAAANRIAHTKWLNLGQTCVAPDYVVCTPNVRDKLVKELIRATTAMTSTPSFGSAEKPRIISTNHVDRIERLLTSSTGEKGGRVVYGGKVNRNERLIEPTIAVDVDVNSPLMQEEIFGPILPIVTFADRKAAVEFVRSRDKPLACYLFTKDSAFIKDVQNSVSAGSFHVNDLMLALFGIHSLRFGGVGESGTGGYHGERSFLCFSNEKAVIKRAAGMEFINRVLRYPPYEAGPRYKLLLRMLCWNRDLTKPGMSSWVPAIMGSIWAWTCATWWLITQGRKRIGN